VITPSRTLKLPDTAFPVASRILIISGMANTPLHFARWQSKRKKVPSSIEKVPILNPLFLLCSNGP
jgi:hypothetical protein